MILIIKGELYGDDDKIIDYLSKKRERDEFNDELFEDIYSFENKKYNNDYYNKIMYINKDVNYNNNIK